MWLYIYIYISTKAIFKTEHNNLRILIKKSANNKAFSTLFDTQILCFNIEQQISGVVATYFAQYRRTIRVAYVLALAFMGHLYWLVVI